MHRHTPKHSAPLAALITLSLLAGAMAPALHAQERRRKPVVVSFGQPNIWSLEQAHYLLARMHMANLDLKAKELTDAELNPNEVHGTRINILKQLLGISAEFDQSVGFNNRRLMDNMRFNDERRRELTVRRSGLQTDAVSLAREIPRLEAERARMDQDKNVTKEAKDLKDLEITKKKEELAAVREQITQDNDELKTLNAAPSGTLTAPTPSASPFSSNSLPTSVLDQIVKEDVKDLLKAASDPKLNASTMLDNTVQLQYEIIAKQLTLLRDEVGPGERLVFLEMPQSVYTTPGSGDEKMAQAWWHVNGYTRTDPLVRLLLDLHDVERRWYEIQRVPAFRAILGSKFKSCKDDAIAAQPTPDVKDVDDTMRGAFTRFKAEHDEARRRVIDKLFRQASDSFDRVEQNGARDTSQTVEAIRRMVTRQAANQADGDGGKDRTGHARTFVGLRGAAAPLTTEDHERQRVERIKFELLEILSKDKPDVCDETKYSFEQGIEFTRLDEELSQAAGAQPAGIERRTVRTVDIIPRQSSLNVNDVQETVKATGILAAFKFLFGFAGQANFQRQREQYEQFLHQELYASGFGKGDRDFGWTFGALPGTKRVAPGVRTTYAALVVPDSAESIVLSARGCYFPRKSYQPLDFEDTAHRDWDRRSKLAQYNCGDEQTYILPIPGGGDTSNFWVTSIDYQPAKKGEYVTVSVRGNNFSSQIGVLVNGVPLDPTVGLAQPHLTPRKSPATPAAPAAPAAGAAAAGTAAPAVGASPATPPAPADRSDCPGICGKYERIDPEQIIFTFKMPANSDGGIPTITLIAPGKSVDLNSLPNLTVNGRRLGQKLDDKDKWEKDREAARLVAGNKDVPLMFGARAPEALSITDLQILNVTPGTTRTVALVSGSGFDKDKDTVFVNGEELTGGAKEFRSPGLYRLVFNLPADESLKVTILQDKGAASKTIPNPAALKLTGASVLSYSPPASKKSRGVMIVRLEGAGFSPRLALGVEGASWKLSKLMDISPGEVLVRLVSPEPYVVITLKDTGTGGFARKSVQRPEPSKEEKKPEGKD